MIPVTDIPRSTDARIITASHQTSSSCPEFAEGPRTAGPVVLGHLSDRWLWGRRQCDIWSSGDAGNFHLQPPGHRDRHESSRFTPGEGGLDGAYRKCRQLDAPHRKQGFRRRGHRLALAKRLFTTVRGPRDDVEIWTGIVAATGHSRITVALTGYSNDKDLTTQGSAPAGGSVGRGRLECSCQQRQPLAVPVDYVATAGELYLQKIRPAVDSRHLGWRRHDWFHLRREQAALRRHGDARTPM